MMSYGCVCLNVNQAGTDIVKAAQDL